MIEFRRTIILSQKENSGVVNENLSPLPQAQKGLSET